MPTIKALLEKMHNQPAGIRFEELQRVLEYCGYQLVRIKGSHAQFRNGAGDVLTIKKETPVKAVYVKYVLRRVGKQNESEKR